MPMQTTPRAPTGFALSPAPVWRLTDPEDPDPARLVTAWTNDVPPFAVHGADLAASLQGACRAGAERGAARIGVLAGLVRDRLITGLIDFIVVESPAAPRVGDDLGRQVRELYGPAVELADVAEFELGDGARAIRIRMLDDVTVSRDTPGELIVIDQVRYFVPAAGTDIVAIVEFVTAELDVSDALIEQADLLMATFRWTYEEHHV